MGSIFFHNAYLQSKWQSNVTMKLDAAGKIVSLEPDSKCSSDATIIEGPVIPGIPNVHSHAFQRAIVGLTEYRTGEQDSFWTWRELMYQSVERLNHEDCYVVARQLYSEMLQAGYTSVGEFHYLHHASGDSGSPQKMADAVIRAAVDAGLPICFLPVFYQQGGFDGRPLVGGQRQFFLDDNEFAELLRYLNQRWADEPLVSFGMAIHSLRAVALDKIQSIVDRGKQILGDVPVHVHVSEQVAEVEQAVATHRARPVELLYSNANVDSKWCLIHATHLNDNELDLISQSGAVVGLCPTTEANLGDGIFRSDEFKQRGGRISIGSDSHIGLNPFGEMRLIEYAQRLTQRNRAILSTESSSTGSWLFDQIVSSGAQVLNRNFDEAGSGLAIGNHADFVVLKSDDANLLHMELDRVFDKLVFFESPSSVSEVWIAGQAAINGDSQEGRQGFLEEFRTTMQRLHSTGTNS